MTDESPIHVEGDYLTVEEALDQLDDVSWNWIDEDRTHGKCAHCKTRFSLATVHIEYGGLLWCSEECLAKCVVENDIDDDKVARKMQRRPTPQEIRDSL